MSETVKSIVFASLDEIRTGHHAPDLPLHVTVVPPFEHDRSQTNEVTGLVGDYLTSADQISIIGDRAEMFGHDNSISVMRVIGNKALYTIHNELLSGLSALPGIEIDDTFAGDNYSPHSTNIGNRGIEEGEALVISTLYMAQRKKYVNAGGTHKVWRIVEEFKLGQ